MGKKLKLGFAMGGGVSLGTFSGAGLSETIKQAILSGGYYEGTGANKKFKEYDEVEVDVFAGASAGSMSLAIMLRGLAYQSAEERRIAIERLDNEKDESVRQKWEYIKRNSPKKRDALIAAEVVQYLQEEIWIKEINIDKLLGIAGGNAVHDLTYEPGFLRRGALEEIAKKYFALDEAYRNKFDTRQVLADRVLFASTLANLTGVKFDARQGTIETDPNYTGSEDAYTSFSHKELRVFDLFFKEVDSNEIWAEWKLLEDWDAKDESTKQANRNIQVKYPRKWMRYHIAKEDKGTIGSICTHRAWSRIVSTSIACGAFPFAFEPVVLSRYRFEYGKDWPAELARNVYPFTGQATAAREDLQTYPFTYVDGGTFNNEPVREAFRMAAYLDAEEEKDYDRIIVFVDPNIGSSPMKFRVPVHQQYAIHEQNKLGRFDTKHLERLPTMDRLLAHVSTMLTLLTDEARVNENDKINQTARLFQQRDEYYKIVSDLIENATVSRGQIKELNDLLERILEDERENELLPPGAVTVKIELLRVLRTHKTVLGSLTEDEVKQFANSYTIPAGKEKVLLKALYMVFLDTVMNLAGKSRESKIIAIAPVVRDEKGREIPCPLPGRHLQAFSGFTSVRANVYAKDLGKYCAKQFMRLLQLLPPDYSLGEQPQWKDSDQKGFENDFRSKLVYLNNRIDNIFDSAKVLDKMVLDNLALNILAKKVKKALAEMELKEDPKISFQLRIEVADRDYELDGRDNGQDVLPVKIEGKLYLLTELYYHSARENKWDGMHEHDNFLVIDNPRTVLWDKAFCRIALPTDEQVKLANLLPNPIFVLKHRITDEHKGWEFGSDDWTFEPGVIPLEDTLIRDARLSVEKNPVYLKGEPLSSSPRKSAETKTRYENRNI